MVLPSGERIERLPAWSRRVVQNLAVSPVYEGLSLIYVLIDGLSGVLESAAAVQVAQQGSQEAR